MTKLDILNRTIDSLPFSVQKLIRVQLHEALEEGYEVHRRDARSELGRALVNYLKILEKKPNYSITPIIWSGVVEQWLHRKGFDD